MILLTACKIGKVIRALPIKNKIFFQQFLDSAGASGCSVDRLL
jgi:hypothetical protein